jgi:hypothetical protein
VEDAADLLGIKSPGNLENEFKHTEPSGRLFGGIGFQMLKFHLDLTGLYNFADSRYGVSIGGRFQI